ncbi:unnamed protein product [Notodromas monacha]|uniref:Calponin-homology (CH) domain-containing protein n=1 Tax=Notodromas monacha TaxID=399045 RepID=A0A7R9GH85_9CRUS|nr:unnamed protein product [Notodromas monacha]CAG0920654.1 unnamed protein product [Notodromas monacha]
MDELIEENTRLLESMMGRKVEPEARTIGISHLNTSYSPVPTDSPLPGIDKKRVSLADSSKIGAKKTLLQWVKTNITDKYGIPVKDFGASWRDGRAFLAIVHCIDPALVDITMLNPQGPWTNMTRLETAFKVAERHLGVSPLMDAEDVDVAKPDEKSIMTYVAQFLHKYPDLALSRKNQRYAVCEILTNYSLRHVADQSSIGKAEHEYDDLTYWLAEVTQVLYSIKQSPGDENAQKKFAMLRREIDEKRKEYEHLKTLALSGQSMVSITIESWTQIQRQWDQLNYELHNQQRAFDSKLEGRIGAIGDWIYRGEALVSDVDSLSRSLLSGNDPGLSYKSASQKLQDHRAFFAELARVEKELANVKSKPEEWAGASGEQIADLHRRILALPRPANRREVRLFYIERKCFLLWFLLTAETKLREWTTSYGKESRVQEMLEDYERFVSNRNVFQEFDKAYKDLQKASQLYTDEFNPDTEEAREISRISHEVSDRWATVSVELRCVHSLLEKVIMFWRHYSSTAENLESWLDTAAAMVKADEDQKMEFFRDLPEWQESHHSLNEVGRFLAATCEDRVAEEVDSRLNQINDRWDAVYPMVRHYMRSGEILRTKKEWEGGRAEVSDWIAKADGLLGARHPPNPAALAIYQDQLKKLQSELDRIQETLRKNSRVFQLLVPELPPDHVHEMMGCLKKHKEDLVRINATIPTRLVMLHQLSSQREAIDSGLKEVSDWIEEAKTRLKTQGVSGNAETLQRSLDSHRVFFSRAPYYRSILESKNAVFNGLQRSTTDLDSSLDLSDVSRDIDAHWEEFNRVCADAQAAEQALYKAVCCWQKLKDTSRDVSDWVETAGRFFREKTPESRQGLDMQKTFFARPNEHLEAQLTTARQDLCTCLPVAEHGDINMAVQKLIDSWSEAKAYAPLHVLKLEFRLDEITFNDYLKEVDRQLCQQVQSFSQNESPETIMSKHKALFGCEDGCPVYECQVALESMERHLARSCAHFSGPKHEMVLHGFQATVQNCKDELEKMRTRAHDFIARVSHVPAQWETYREKFSEMETWMDDVNVCLSQISKDLLSIEEFEGQRAKLQVGFECDGICREVEAKREEMKRLVQILDSLLMYASEAQAADEQSNLEGLISRYRSLVPSIEATLTKSDVWSKAYAFKREANELCNFLNTVNPLVDAAEASDSLAIVSELKEDLEKFANQVEAKREALITCMQRGRDLIKDPHVPTFVKDDLSSLEEGWNVAQMNTLRVTEKLKSTAKLWSEFEAKKSELLQLLEKAKDELKTSAPRHDPVKVIAELQTKKSLLCQLEEGTTNLSRLENLAEALSSSSESPASLQTLMTSFQSRLDAVKRGVEERIGALEEYSKKFSEFSSELRAIKDWMLEAQKILESLLMKTGPPAQREVKSRQLNADVRDSLLKVSDLEKRAREFMLGYHFKRMFLMIGPDESVQDSENAVLPLSTEILGVKEVLVKLVETVELQHRVSAEELTQWEGFQTGLETVRPWLGQVETQLVEGIPRFTTLIETKNALESWKVINQECLEKQKTLVLLKAKSEQMPESTLEEFDSLQCRWASVREQAESNLKTLQELKESWEKCLNGIEEHRSWIDSAKSILISCSETAVGDVASMAVKMKNLCKEAGERQASLLVLSQDADKVASRLSSEGASSLKNEVVSLRNSYIELIQSSRKILKSLTELVMARDDLTHRMQDFKQWLGVRRARVLEINEIPSADIETTSGELGSILRDITDQRPVFAKLRSDAKKVQDSDGGLPALEAAIQEDLDETEALIEAKRRAITKCQEILRWSKDTEEKLDLMRKHLYAPLGPDEFSLALGKIERDLSLIAEHMESKPGEIRNCEALSEAASLKVILTDGESLHQLGEKICALVAVRKREAAERGEEFNEAKSDHASFDSLRNALRQLIESTLEEVKTLKPSQNTAQGIKQVSENALQKKRVLESKKPESERLQTLCDRIGSREPRQKSLLQAEIDALYTHWLRADSNALELSDNCRRISANWEQANEFAETLQQSLEKVAQTLATTEAALDSKNAVVADQQTCKQNLDLLKRIRAQIEHCVGRFSHIQQALESIPQLRSTQISSPCPALQKNWQNLVDSITKRTQSRDTLIVILEDIEQQKEELSPWIEKMNSALVKSQDSESLAIFLESFNAELPVHESIMTSLNEKIADICKTGAFSEVKRDIDNLNKDLQKCKASALDSTSKLEAQAGEERLIREKLRALNDRILLSKSSLMKLLEPTTNEQLLMTRVADAKHALTGIEPEMECLQAIKGAIGVFKKQHPTEPSIGLLSKDAENAEKILQGCKALAGKVISTLSSALMKKPTEEVKELERRAKAAKDKLSWLDTTDIPDFSALEAKINWVNDRKDEIRVLANDVTSTSKTLSRLQSNDVSTPALLGKLKADLAATQQTVANVAQDTETVTGRLSALKDQWSELQDLEERLQGDMKALQLEYRQLSSGSTDASIGDEKAAELCEQLQAKVGKLCADAEVVGEKANALVEACPGCDAAQTVSTIASKCCSMSASLSDFSKRLNQRDSARRSYEAAVIAARKWLVAYADRLLEFETLDSSLLLTVDPRGGGKPSLACQAKLNSLKDFINEKSAGQELLNTAVTCGEALFGELSVPARENVREELRGLRSTWETLLDKLNGVEKKFESVLLQWTSFDDSFNQTNLWLQDITQRIGVSMEAKANLLDKKLQFQNLKVIGQELASHKKIMNNLQEKGQELHASHVVGDMEKLVKQYEDLCRDAERRIAVSEKLVMNHEDYQHRLERFVDWMNCLKGEVSFLLETSATGAASSTGSETDVVESMLEVVNGVLSKKDEGQKQLDGCKALLASVKTETHESGRPLLDANFDCQVEAWKHLLAQCVEAKESVQAQTSKFHTLETGLSDLTAWLKNIDRRVKEQSALKPSAQAKETQLDKLKQLIKELDSRAADVVRSAENIRSAVSPLELAESKLNFQASHLSSRFQHLKNHVKDLVGRYENFVKDHKEFDKAYENFNIWLAGKHDKLKKLSEIVGERLYPHTAAAGRDKIRTELRDLRDRWDEVEVRLGELQKKREVEAQQRTNLQDSLQQTRAWMESMEKTVAQDVCNAVTPAELRSRLVKIKTVQQEVASHWRLIENMKNKAEKTTPSAEIAETIRDLGTRYDNLTETIKKSKADVEQLQDVLTVYQEQLQAHQQWINDHNDCLTALKDYTGSKQVLKSRLVAVDNFNTELIDWKRALGDMDSTLQTILRKLPPRSRESVEREFSNIKFELEKLEGDLVDVRQELDERLRQWEEYEHSFERLLSWLNESEGSLKEFAPKSTLEEKELQLSKYQNLMNRQPQGLAKLEKVVHMGEVLLASTSTAGQETLANEISALKASFKSLFDEIEAQKKELEGLLSQMRGYKDEYERINDWLQQTDADMKAARTMLLPNLPEKEKQYLKVTRQVEELESRQDEVQRLSSSAATLLSSHLDSYIQSQLRHLQSRYQVQVNLAKDTSQKVTAIYQHHKQMEDNRAAGMTWIDAAKAVIRDGEGLSSSSRKEDLLQHLQDIQVSNQLIALFYALFINHLILPLFFISFE